VIDGFRVLWRAIVHLYDESLLMLKANFVWFVATLPFFFLIVAICWLLVPAPEADEGLILWPLMLACFAILVLPTPFAFGVYALTSEIVTGDTPEFGVLWQAVARWWRRSLVMFFIGGLVLGGLIFNVVFYANVMEGWVQAVSIVWLYGAIFWVTLHTYLIPVHYAALRDPEQAAAGPPPIRTLYRRAAILSLANPIFSLVLLLGTVLVVVISSLALPVYPLIAMAYVALIGSRALKDLRDKYFPPEPDDSQELKPIL
jgi:hypothetical protein